MQASAFTAKEFYDRLPLFFAFIKNLGLKAGPDTCLAVLDLIFVLRNNRQWPTTAHELAAYLAPILVRTPEQQYDFYKQFQYWYLNQTIAEDTPDDPIPDPNFHWDGPKKKTFVRYMWVVLILAGLFIALYFTSPNRNPIEPREPPVVEETTEPELEESTTGKVTPIALGTTITPPSKQRVWPHGDWFLPLLPQLLLLFLWRIFHRKRHLILCEYQSIEDDPFQQLALKTSNAQLPFSGLSSCGVRRSVRYVSRRLNVPASVDKSLRQGGLFSPQYRIQYRAPEYLLLIDRLHLSDHVSALADCLLQQIKHEGVLAHSYYYQHSPRVCFAAATGAKRTLNQLLSHYAHARVFMVGDGAGLFNSYTGQLLPWVKDLNRWQDKAWFSTEPQPWGLREFSLMNQGFLVVPFNLDGIELINRTLQQGRGLVPGWCSGESDDKFPRLLLGDTQQWLSETPPENTSVPDLVHLLRHYMGPEDFILLQALAAYPMPTANLTLALEQKLFRASKHNRGRGEEAYAHVNRLLKLSRLPWCRHGKMPRYLRRALADEASPSTEAAIADAYFELFAEAKPAHAHDLLKIPFVSQTKKQVLLHLLTQLWGRHRTLGDRLFIRVLLGRKRPWYLRISEQLARVLKLNIYQARLMAGLACFSVFTSAGIFFLWRDHISPILDDVTLDSPRATAGSRETWCETLPSLSWGEMTLKELTYTCIPNGWEAFFNQPQVRDQVSRISDYLERELEKPNKTLSPSIGNTFRALYEVPAAAAKVVIMGQEPAPQPGLATGLAFSLPPGTPTSAIAPVQRVFLEAQNEQFCNDLNNGDASGWADQDVLLLNMALTIPCDENYVCYGGIADHVPLWESFTQSLMAYIDTLEQPMAFILWGSKARAFKETITRRNHRAFEGGHPSPRADGTKFFCQNYFRCSNEWLSKQGSTPVNWTLGVSTCDSDGACVYDWDSESRTSSCVDACAEVTCS